MATDRNDQLLADILGEFRGLGAVLGEIRDRLPATAPADDGEPNRVSIREPLVPDSPADDTATPPARKTASRRSTKPTKIEE